MLELLQEEQMTQTKKAANNSLDRLRHHAKMLGDRWEAWMPPDYNKDEWEHPVDYMLAYFWPYVTVTVLALLFVGLLFLAGWGLVRLVQIMFDTGVS
jgi:hypothetical protein